jgi:thiaminase
MKSYGENFEKWRNAARPEWDSSVRHPFVIKLANDSLSDAHYGHYLAQCYAYLRNV